MKHLNIQAKNAIRKNRISTCGYIYTDGISIVWDDRHYYKGKEFRSEKQESFPGEVKVYTNNGTFEGRLVMHNPTLLMEPIDNIHIYYGNTSETMKEMNLSCTTVQIQYKNGMQIREHVFPFIASDITIQNGQKMSLSESE